jgi:hypothetical protein
LSHFIPDIDKETKNLGGLGLLFVAHFIPKVAILFSAALNKMAVGDTGREEQGFPLGEIHFLA